MGPFLMISALVTSYMCVVQGPCRLRNWINHGARHYIMSRLRYRDHDDVIGTGGGSIVFPNDIDAPDSYESPCTTPNNAGGTCINLYDCPALMTIINKQNKSPQDIQLLRNSKCGFQGDVPKVCCPENTCFTPEGEPGKCVGIYSCPHMAELLKPPVAKETVSYVQKARCTGPEQYSICCGPPPNQVVSTESPKTPDGQCRMTATPVDPTSGCCGLDINSGDRIVGGNVTAVDEYPWLALIEYVKDNRIKLLCGAALISGRYVLTAGHCVKGQVLDYGTPRNVRLGEFDTSHDGRDCLEIPGGGEDCTEGTTVIAIEKTLPHPDYEPSSNLRRNDIALIRLRQMAPYTDFIRPICLPTQDFTANPPSKFTVIAAGWGAVSNTVGHSDLKLHVDLPFRSKDECQPAYSIPRRSVALWKGQLCAGGVAGKDSCKGDSGGPLMYLNDRHFEVIGIVSFGPTPCGMENIPGVYTNVYEYMPWMQSQIGP